MLWMLQDPEENIPMPPQDFSDIKPKPEIGVVLASFDMHFNYKKMSKAFNYLSHNEGCVLLLSNDDLQVPLQGGSTAAGECIT
jgi:4-nitrophenyl phosphatase